MFENSEYRNKKTKRCTMRNLYMFTVKSYLDLRKGLLY